MQTSYQLDLDPVQFPGQLADSGPADIISCLSLGPGSQSVTATPANSTVYTLTLTNPDATTKVVTYTSDSSATAAEIYAGLISAAAALGGLDYTFLLVNGVLTLMPKIDGHIPNQVVTSTGAGTLTLAASSGDLPFGVGVVYDADAQRVRLPAASGDVGLNTAGILLSSQFLESEYHPANFNNPPFYPAGSLLNVCRGGRVWVKVEQAVVVGGPVYLRYTANGALKPGGWRTDADTSNAAQLTGAKYLDNAAASGFARIQLNIA